MIDILTWHIMLQATYSVGVKGISEPAKVDEVDKIVMATLQQLAKDGFEDSAIEASLNSLEFKLREFNTGGFPRGLSFMLGSLSSWLYGRDPTEPLRFEKPLADLRSRLAKKERVFQDLIQKYFLENKHKVCDLNISLRSHRGDPGSCGFILFRTFYPPTPPTRTNIFSFHCTKNASECKGGF
jgi:Zn-dependent M16 (insulinase) family peptidase